MIRFRPTIEPLDARTLPSAVIGLPDDPSAGAAQSAQLADEHAPEEVGHTAQTSAAKVTMNDFSFVMKVNKSSPLLN